ncbi:hypothetical protein EC604_04025 [Paenibacillus amylolyticus]|uniref:Uncharacterized protein n=1 Tax=Paenibacillus amylolyticus TaxID=1451 RepID=A0A5M9WN52_PAEAM|nr:hypothetical protein [Paenibacillus amylolyticus]KAA8783012.1 hypothetical protein EC604_04025 [Paenibacillus amylolyticus]
MTHFLKRYMKHAIVALIVIMLTAQIPLVKELLARGATTLYVAAKYPDQTVTFAHFEYQPHFGDYIISYTVPKTDALHLMLAPKLLPIFVKFDPWDQPMSD